MKLKLIDEKIKDKIDEAMNFEINLLRLKKIKKNNKILFKNEYIKF